MTNIDVSKFIKAPVRWDGHAYFFDANHNMIGDMHKWDKDGFRIRGWGWIQYLWDERRNPKIAKYLRSVFPGLSNDDLSEKMGEVQDAIAEFIAAAINEKLDQQKKNICIGLQQVRVALLIAGLCLLTTFFL